MAGRCVVTNGVRKRVEICGEMMCVEEGSQDVFGSEE